VKVKDGRQAFGEEENLVVDRGRGCRQAKEVQRAERKEYG
jgi:hypothetical protein